MSIAEGSSVFSLPDRPPSSTAAGDWRPDLPFIGSHMTIMLKREPGVTPAGYLSVPFRFHAPPIDRFGRAWTFDWQTYNTIGAGEQARDGSGRQLERLSFQTMLLDDYHDWMVWNGSLDVQRMLRELKAITYKPAPFRLVIAQPALWGSTPLVNGIFVFTSLTPEQRGGEIGTEYTSVEFMEIKRDKLATTARRLPRESEQPRRHTLVHGDTLYALALKFYFRKGDWTQIAQANGILRVGPDSSEALEDWAKQHHRKTLKIPALVDTVVNGDLGRAVGT